MNKIIITGRLVADPELRQTPSNISVCRFRVAVNRPYAKEGEVNADFFNCVAWRQSAEFITKYYKKGSAIVIEGSMRNADFTDSKGVKHYAMELQVERVEFGESKKVQTDTTGDSANIDLSGYEETGTVPY